MSLWINRRQSHVKLMNKVNETTLFVSCSSTMAAVPPAHPFATQGQRSLQDSDPEVAGLIGKEKSRQQHHIELIASEVRFTFIKSEYSFSYSFLS